MGLRQREGRRQIRAERAQPSGRARRSSPRRTPQPSPVRSASGRARTWRRRLVQDSCGKATGSRPTSAKQNVEPARRAGAHRASAHRAGGLADFCKAERRTRPQGRRTGRLLQSRTSNLPTGQAPTGQAATREKAPSIGGRLSQHRNLLGRGPSGSPYELRAHDTSGSTFSAPAARVCCSCSSLSHSCAACIFRKPASMGVACQKPLFFSL